MPLDWDKLSIKIPKFDDRQTFLKTCGGYVVKEIIAMIDREEQPDGSPQKQNSDYTRLEKQIIKGYTTPLKGAHFESPYLARRSMAAWLRTFHPPDTVVIELNAKRKQIGIKLQQMGYWFMGITRKAKKQIVQAADRYVKLKTRQMKQYGYD
ncbi:MAG: hypothetical protein PHO67_08360 [Candidatus Omnitrophica bacterium]|nr:hypothetical protein [Candidatus Omnitrophota bacterium]